DGMAGEGNLPYNLAGIGVDFVDGNGALTVALAPMEGRGRVEVSIAVFLPAENRRGIGVVFGILSPDNFQRIQINAVEHSGVIRQVHILANTNGTGLKSSPAAAGA